MDLINLLYVLGTTVVVLAIGFGLSKYLKRKNILNPNVVDFSQQIIILLRIITMKTFSEERQRQQISEIFEAIQSVFTYIYLTTTDKTHEEKKELARKQIIERLQQFNIEIDDEDMLLIDLIIDTYVSLLPEE